MQSVSDWRKGINQSTGNTGVQSVADWRKTNPATQVSTQQAPQKQDLATQAENLVKNYAESSEKTVYTMGEALLHPIETLKKLPSMFSKPFLAGIKKASTPVQGGNIITDTANLITGVAESIFSPVTGVFSIAENIPGAKQVAEVLSLPFTALGMATSFGTGKIVDALPVSDETKAVIKKPLEDLSSTVAQVYLGGKIMDKISNLSKTGEKVTPETVKPVVEEAIAEAKQQKPALFPEKAQVQEAGQTVADWKKQGTPEKPAQDLTYEPTESVSGLAKSAKSKLLRDKIIADSDKRFDELPVLEKRVKKEDVAKSTDYVLNNPSEAFQVAMATRRAPDGMLPTDVYASMHDYLSNTNEIGLLSKLINESGLNRDVRYMGQNIQALARLGKDSFDSKIKSIKQVREQRIFNYDKKKGDIIKTIKKEAKKIHLSKAELNWDKFLDENIC